MLRNGADEVVNPEKQVALWTAVRYSAEHLLDFIQLDGDNAIFEVEVPKTWLGKTIKQIDIRRRYNVNIMAVKKNGKMNLTVTPDEVFDPDETIMVVGSYKDVQKCFHI